MNNVTTAELRKIVRHTFPRLRQSTERRLAMFRGFSCSDKEAEEYRVQKIAEMEYVIQAIVEVMEEPKNG